MSSVNHQAGVTFNMIVGGVIRDARERSRLTQAECAAKLKMPASTLSRIEKGNYNCSVSQLACIASGLGTKPSELMRQIEQTVQYVNSQGLLIADKDEADLGGLLLGAAAIAALIMSARN